MSTKLEETVTRVRGRAVLPNAQPAVSSSTVHTAGQSILNGAFTLRGGQNPDVPVTYGLHFLDSNASVSAGDVDISYQDDTDTARVDNFDIITDGLGPHFTSFPVKSVTSVVGQNFVGHAALDTLLVGPAIPDTADACIGTTGREAFDPIGSMANSGDGDAAYIESAEITDQRFYVGFNSITQFNPVSITSVSIHAYVKQFSGGSGIQMLFRLGSADSDWVIGTFTTATNTEDGASTSFLSGSLTTNPKTGNPWTPAEIDILQVGFKFIGDNPGIVKRVNFLRVHVAYNSGFRSDDVDGTDPAEQINAWQAVNKDPFTTPTSPEDDAKHQVAIPGGSDRQFIVHVEDLPPEALTVDQLDNVVRCTYFHMGEQNGGPENDMPCKTATNARGGNQSASRIEGPLEQSNIGGFQMFASVGGSITGARHAIGPGDPPGGCGPFSDFSGDDVGWGVYVEKTQAITLNSSSNPITVANANAMLAGISMDDPSKEYRISRVYVQANYKASPVGGTYLHLVIDDDPLLAPDDSNYQQSQHTNNKKFGVDFAGIPEVLAVNSVKVVVRAEVAKPASAQGWRIIWRDGIGNSGSDVVETAVKNNGFANFEYTRTLSPFNGGTEPWTREEANRLVIIWEAIGENDYFEKRLSGMIVEMDVDLIPDKIDSSRNTSSRRLRLLRKPVPFLEVGLPPSFADARVLGDLTVNHNAIPRIAATLGFERWDKSLMRVFKKRIGHENDIVTLTVLDLREFLSTLWVTGQTKTRGQSAEGMAVLTPGVDLQFIRATNDYHVAPTGDLLQELNGDEPPTGLDGILIQNGATNRVLNSAFAEGATNVFTDWTQTIGAGGAIAENLIEKLFDDDVAGNPPRTVELTGPTTASDGAEISTDLILDRGDSPLSPEGNGYQVGIWHKDNSGAPLSVAVRGILLPSFNDEHFDFNEGNWVSNTEIWYDLPVRSVPTYDRLPGALQNMSDMPTSPVSETITAKLRLSSRTTTGAINSVYGAQIEGGTVAGGTESRYPTNFILTRNGPVVRDGMQFFINNEAQRPIYPANLRGTFAIEFVPLWDSAELPNYAGVRRYVYGYVIDAFNEDSFYYDSDTESFVFLRKIAGVSKTISLFYPQVTRGIPVQVATRWISELGDLDETPFSFSFFVNNIASPSDSHTQALSLPSSKPLYIGSRDGTDGEMIDAVVRKLEIKQLALPQAAIPRLFT